MQHKQLLRCTDCKKRESLEKGLKGANSQFTAVNPLHVYPLRDAPSVSRTIYAVIQGRTVEAAHAFWLLSLSLPQISSAYVNDFLLCLISCEITELQACTVGSEQRSL